MENILSLAKLAIRSNDEELKRMILSVRNYQDKTGCIVYSEIINNKIIVYDVTNIRLLLCIELEQYVKEAI